MTTTLVPDQITTSRLALMLGPNNGMCSVCDSDEHGVSFVLTAFLESGQARHEGVEICPTCARQHGYASATLLGLAALERAMLDEDPVVRGGTDDDVRADFAHLRGLIPRMTAPPPLSLAMFTKEGSGVVA